MEYRLGIDMLFSVLSAWDQLLPGGARVRLIACGGTALTLLGYKPSTKDVDLLVPDLDEFRVLVSFLERAGYRKITQYGWQRPGEVIVFDLYPGNKVYTTELASSPLAENGNRKIREWKKVYLGTLNEPDIIITKLFRGTAVDFDDCLEILRHEPIDLDALTTRLHETAKWDIGEDKAKNHLEILLERFRK